MVTARFLANFDKKHIRKNYDVTNDVIIIRNKSDENGLYNFAPVLGIFRANVIKIGNSYLDNVGSKDP